MHLKISVFGKALAGLLLILLLLPACSKQQTRKDGPFDPQASLAQAEEQIAKGEYEEARKILVETKNRDTSKQYAPLAQLKLADSFIRDGDYDPGIEEYRKFIELYPENQYAYYAQYQIAMAYFNQIESPDRGSGAAQKALQEFQRLKEKYPRNPYREAVELRIEKCRNIIAEGEFLVGEYYYKKGSYSSAIGRFETLLNKFPDFKRSDETLYLLGRSYRYLLNNEKAVSSFTLLMEKYPESRFAREVKRKMP